MEMNIEHACQWNNCTESFKSNVMLFKHCKKYHLTSKSKECYWSTCQALLSNRSNLANHLNTHLNVVQGICHICDKNYVWRSDYRKHMKKHSEADIRFNDIVHALLSIEDE